jgi:hypothetical protein
MLLTRDNPKYLGGGGGLETLSQCHFITTANLTLSSVGLNPDLCGERSATY